MITRPIKLYHRTQLHYRNSNTRQLVKFEDTSIISPTCSMILKTDVYEHLKIMLGIINFIVKVY